MKPTQEYRLPTDVEWSTAVGLPRESGSTPQVRGGKIKGVYPWGTQWPPPRGAGNYAPELKVDDFVNTGPVGSFAANQFGLYDLGGNAWEWCEDFYASQIGGHVLRGAAWSHGIPELQLLSSFRLSGTPNLRRVVNGFRVVLASGPLR